MIVDEANKMPSSSDFGFASHYGRDTRANVAVIAALAILPILAIAGIAIDVQMALTEKGKVQAVIDSAVIAGSKAMQAGKSQEQINTLVQDYVDALVSVQGSGLSCTDPELTFLDGTQNIEAEIRCAQTTTLTQLLHRDKLFFRVRSGTTYGIGNVDVAFIFDVSGSMN